LLLLVLIELGLIRFVAPTHPPIFFTHAGDDSVPAEGSVRFWQELRRNGVTSELHVFPSGGHGYGLRPSKYPVTDWPALCGDWLNSMDFLKR
tara:strand:- start:1169 stop:1444 length:276 start_codon:yes stop_codon:yes gene_type:complete